MKDRDHGVLIRYIKLSFVITAFSYHQHAVSYHLPTLMHYWLVVDFVCLTMIF
jgi:hypothetical protein